MDINKLTKNELLKTLSNSEAILKRLETRYALNWWDGNVVSNSDSNENGTSDVLQMDPFFQISRYLLLTNEAYGTFKEIDVFALERHIPSKSIDFMIAKATNVKDEDRVCMGMSYVYNQLSSGKRVDAINIGFGFSERNSIMIEPIFYGELQLINKKAHYELGVRPRFKATDMYSGKPFNELQLQKFGCYLGKINDLNI